MAAAGRERLPRAESSCRYSCRHADSAVRAASLAAADLQHLRAAAPASRAGRASSLSAEGQGGISEGNDVAAICREDLECGADVRAGFACAHTAAGNALPRASASATRACQNAPRHSWRSPDGILSTGQEPVGSPGDALAPDREREVALSLEHDAMLEEEMARVRMQEQERERARDLDIAHEERDREGEALHARCVQIEEREDKAYESDEQDSLDSASRGVVGGQEGDYSSGLRRNFPEESIQRKVVGLNRHHNMLLEEMDREDGEGQVAVEDGDKPDASSTVGMEGLENDRSLQGISLRELATEWSAEQGRTPFLASSEAEPGGAASRRYRGVTSEIYREQRMAAYREAFADVRRSAHLDVAGARADGPQGANECRAGAAWRRDSPAAGATSPGMERSLQHVEPSSWAKKQALEKEFHYQRTKSPQRAQVHWDMNGRRIRAESPSAAERNLDEGPLDGEGLQRGASVGALEELEMVLTRNESGKMERARDVGAAAEEVRSFEDTWIEEEADMIQKSMAAQREAERVIAKYKIQGVLSPSPAKEKVGATAVRWHTRPQLAVEDAPAPPGREVSGPDAASHGAPSDDGRGRGGAGAHRAGVPSQVRQAQMDLKDGAKEGLPEGARDGCRTQHAAAPRASDPPAMPWSTLQTSSVLEKERPAWSSPDRKQAQGPQKMIDAMTASTAQLRSFLANGAEQSLVLEDKIKKRESGRESDVNPSRTPARLPPRGWSSPSDEQAAAEPRSAERLEGVDGVCPQNLHRTEEVGAGLKRDDEAPAADGSAGGQEQRDPVSRFCPRARRCLLALLPSTPRTGTVPARCFRISKLRCLSPPPVSMACRTDSPAHRWRR